MNKFITRLKIWYNQIFNNVKYNDEPIEQDNLSVEKQIEHFDDFVESISVTEYGKFEDVVDKHSIIPLCHAMIMLSPFICLNNGLSSTEIVSHVEKSQIYFNVDLMKLFSAATRAFVIDLVRCGITFDKEQTKLVWIAPAK